MKQFLLRNIPEDLHVRLKIQAAEISAQEKRVVSMNELIIEAIREKLEKEDEKYLGPIDPDKAK